MRMLSVKIVSFSAFAEICCNWSTVLGRSTELTGMMHPM